MKIKTKINDPENTVIEPADFLKLGQANGIFPLFTKQDLAERWGKSIQLINNWGRRHSDFPEKFSGILIQDQGEHTRGFYPAYAVYKYEKTRGLVE